MHNQKTYLNDNAKIYLVATPIGNYEDISLRAINILKTVDMIYCEDTRNTLNLLNYLGITAKLKSYHLFNENETTSDLINKVKNGMNIAIVSDAGMPVVSDPGYVAVKEAIKEGIDIAMVPGPTAGVSAICASGIPANHYLFYGFLNARQTKRIKELEELKYIKYPIIFYEAPHRIQETLKDILDIFGDRYICLARELTKKYEEYLRGHISEILEVIDSLKGEMVIIVDYEENKSDNKLNDLSILEHYNYYLKIAKTPKEAMKMVASDRNISTNEVYKEIKIK